MKEKNDMGTAIVNEIVEINKDNVIDYGEIALDSILEDGILKEVPFVKTVIAGTKTALAIRDRRFIKKTLVFLQEIRTGHADLDKINNFKDKLKEDEKYRQKITDLITTMIDNHLQEIQSKVFARLIISHINGEVDYEKLVNLSIVLDKLHPIGYKAILQLDRVGVNGLRTEKYYDYGFDTVYEGILLSAGIGTKNGDSFALNKLAGDLWDFGIRYLYEPYKNGEFLENTFSIED